MTGATRPTFDALIMAAVDATAAAQGWLLTVDDEHFVVAAAAGGDQPGSRVGRRVEIAGTAGLALNSGQAAAIQPSGADRSNEGAGGVDGTPASIMAVPCGEEEVLGVIELVGKAGGGPFSFDDVELVSLLARVGGGALAETEGERAVPSPTELAGELERLAATDARGYAALAHMIQAVLGQS